MNKTFILLLAASLAACTGNASKDSAQDSVKTEVNNAQAAIIEFEKGSHDFGKITQGQKVSYSFKFKNKGKTPLIITNATASCGCTVPQYPHEPIAPGKEGVIDVTFDSTGKTGMQNKAITITSNAVPAVSEVYLTGEVKDVQTKSK